MHPKVQCNVSEVYRQFDNFWFHNDSFVITEAIPVENGFLPCRNKKGIQTNDLILDFLSHILLYFLFTNLLIQSICDKNKLFYLTSFTKFLTEGSPSAKMLVSKDPSVKTERANRSKNLSIFLVRLAIETNSLYFIE